jgi:hypothetical protein
MSAERNPAPCNACQRETDHELLWEDHGRIDIPDGSHKSICVSVLRCRGCNECVTKREEIFFPASLCEGELPPEPLVFYSPPRLWRRPVHWLSELEELDPDLFGLLNEIYCVAHEDSTRLLSMGVRAALDHLMLRMLGHDQGGFEEKLKEMVEVGHLTKAQQENLTIVIDAGSASTHRGYKPARQLLDGMLTITEHLIHDHYIAAPMLKTAKAHIPPRPPRQKKEKGPDATRVTNTDPAKTV